MSTTTRPTITAAKHSSLRAELAAIDAFLAMQHTQEALNDFFAEPHGDLFHREESFDAYAQVQQARVDARKDALR